jgi:Domain of unknown function (DUF4258)
VLRFTRHARNRMRRPRITEDDVELCITQPSNVSDSELGRLNYWRPFREGTLRVTALEESGDFVIITVTLI